MLLKKVIISVICTFLLMSGFARQVRFAHIDITQGLTSNRVQCFAEDENGFVWIGTSSGLNRFDGYNIKTFQHEKADSTSLPHDDIQSIVYDQLGQIWVLTAKGLSLFNTDTEIFRSNLQLNVEGSVYNLSRVKQVQTFGNETLLFLIPDVGVIAHNIVSNTNKLLQIESQKSLISAPHISWITVRENKLYIIFNNGSIHIFDLNKRKVESKIQALGAYENFKRYDYRIFIDETCDIWVYTSDADKGLYLIDSTKVVKRFNTGTQPKLNSNIIANVIQHNNGSYWIGTDHGGINILSADKREIQYVKNDEADKSSLSQNVITSMYKTKRGVFWIGTYKKGANFYHDDLYRFNHYMHSVNNSNSLPYNDVNCFAEDDKGNLWIGTNGFGLVHFDRKNNSYKTYKAEPDNPKALQSNVIVSLLIDKQNNLWIGTYHGGLSLFKNGFFKSYQNNPTNPKTLANNRVWDIYEDSKANLWVATLGGGLNKLDRSTGNFQHFSGIGTNAINSQFVMKIQEDNYGNLWFGTDAGLYVFNRANAEFLKFENSINQKASISDNLVNDILIDSKNNLWCGTRSGITLFINGSNKAIPLDKENGLPNNSVMSMVESNNGDLWVATKGGLCQVKLLVDSQGNYKSHSTINYFENDGLQGREFNEGSVFKTSKGELIFGGANGFNMFKPDVDSLNNLNLATYIIGVSIFGKPVSVANLQKKQKESQTSILNNSNISFEFNENVFSIMFVSINILESHKIKYRYKLEGFNNNWIYTDAMDRKATFTNLNPGKYTFKVQASLLNSEWENAQATMDLKVNPPWYRTWLAYFLYYACLVMVIVLARRMVIARERMKYLHAEAERESERQQELNILKTRFFTNVSHEFRTPITLILTPLEKLLKTDISAGTRKHLELMNQNANRLLNLVNQLLDFRKAEENKIHLNLIFGNVIGFIGSVVNSFAELRETKNIKLEFHSEEKELLMQFDKDKIEKIMMNLLSNAFKFTAEDGNIRVFVESSIHQENELLTIKVEDTGIGISKNDKDKIFERFYQSDLPNEFLAKGSGIGLSLTADFVKLHGGNIQVESEEGKGSVFIVKLPVDRTAAPELLELELKNTPNLDTSEQVQDLNKSNDTIENKKTLLLVEDNADFRFYLNDSLQSKFVIKEAVNGKQALEILANEHIDLVISDVMMPEMDGFELCEIIKGNADYSHIPVILLTAKSTQQDKLEGLNHGADEYITKPFNFDILEVRVDYLLGLRKKFIYEYQQSFKVKVDDKRVTPLDKKLLDRAMDLINANISNSEFSVEGMSKELGMSRVYLYKKMSALTGKTPIELIRLVRLKKAAELLNQGELNVSEITYEVGFSDPKYFSKMFKTEFGVLPSKYKESEV